MATTTVGSFNLPTPTDLFINFKNLLDGGDFTVNPWQRNINGIWGSSGISANISNTVTYFPDRWFAVGGASSSINLSKVTDTSVAGFNASCKVQRTAANANTAAINFGQVMETLDCYRLQGQTVTFSFWAKAGANYSGGNLTVQVVTGTGSNQTAANMVAGSWTSQATPVNSTQALTTTMTRYSFTATLGASITQLGVLLTWTPTGTAGSDDSITVNGLQLELGSQMTDFEHRDAEVELALCQRYCYVIPEPASGVVVGAGMINGTNSELIYIPFPTQMYIAPTVTVAAGSFKFNIAGTATAVAGFAAGSTHTPNAMSLVGTTTATSGQATLLQGGGGAGYVMASSDF